MNAILDATTAFLICTPLGTAERKPVQVPIFCRWRLCHEI